MTSTATPVSLLSREFLDKPIVAADNGLSFEPIYLPKTNQRELGHPHDQGLLIPLALKPVVNDDSSINLEDAVSAIKSLAAQGILNEKLAKHGAILFRGLPINDASDFSKVSHAFGYDPHEIIGIVVDRPELAPNVAPANQSVHTNNIGSHNESPQVPHAPAYIFFYGHKAPPIGGETPIGSSLEIYDIVNKANPEIIKALAEKGVRNEVIYRKEPAYKGNSTIYQAFGKHIKEGDDEETQKRKIEHQIKRYNRDPNYTFFEWLEDDGLKVTNIVPAIRLQPGTGFPGLFTSLAAHYEASKAKEEENLRSKVQALPSYGDGTPIPEEHLEVILDATLKSRVFHKWQQGDFLAIDNRSKFWQGY